MDMTYDIEQWAGRTTRGRHVFNYGFRMFGRELKGWELLKTVPMGWAKEVKEDIYLWKDAKEAGRLARIGITELFDWSRAHKQLLEILSHSMRPQIPPASGLLADVGDVNVLARDPRSDIPAALCFTRGNVCVAVNSVGEEHADVSSIARAVDRLLNGPPKKGRAKLLVKMLAARESESHPVIRGLSRSVPRDAWLQVIAPDGELRREGDALLYLAAVSGTKRIETYLLRT